MADSNLAAPALRRRMLAGHWSLSLAFDELVLTVDAVLRQEITAVLFGDAKVEESIYPVLISIDALRRSGYADSFPQLTSLVSPVFPAATQQFPTSVLGEARSAVDEAAATQESPRDAPYRVQLESAPAALPPAACLHIYDDLRLSESPVDSKSIFTGRIHVFRTEHDDDAPLERLAGYRVRELVLFGTRDEVWHAREEVRNASESLTRRLGLSVNQAVATDPFFAETGQAVQRKAQLIAKSKYELVTQVDDRSLALASFNFSGRKYVEAFDLNTGHDTVSACAGFGLERMAYGLLRQHGSIAKAIDVVSKVLS